jgi:hypothetical protein
MRRVLPDPDVLQMQMHLQSVVRRVQRTINNHILVYRRSKHILDFTIITALFEMVK